MNFPEISNEAREAAMEELKDQSDWIPDHERPHPYGYHVQKLLTAETLRADKAERERDKWAELAIAMLSELRMDYAPGATRDTDGRKMVVALRTKLAKARERVRGFEALDFVSDIMKTAQAGLPIHLHRETRNLVFRFARALAEKLAAAQQKYGLANEWAKNDWMDKCRADLVAHVQKGDPRDVAAYCAFLWHHGERTSLDQLSAATAQIETLTKERDAARSQWQEAATRAAKWHEVEAGPDHMCPSIDNIIAHVQNAQEQNDTTLLSDLVAEDGTGFLSDLRTQITKLRRSFHNAITERDAARADNVRLMETLKDAVSDIKFLAGFAPFGFPGVGNYERLFSSASPSPGAPLMEEMDRLRKEREEIKDILWSDFVKLGYEPNLAVGLRARLELSDRALADLAKANEKLERHEVIDGRAPLNECNLEWRKMVDELRADLATAQREVARLNEACAKEFADVERLSAQLAAAEARGAEDRAILLDALEWALNNLHDDDEAVFATTVKTYRDILIAMKSGEKP